MKKENDYYNDLRLFNEEIESNLKSDFVHNYGKTYHKNIIEGYLMSNGFDLSTVPSYIIKSVFGKRFLIVDGYKKTYRNKHLKSDIDIYIIIYRNKLFIAINSDGIDNIIMERLNIFKKLYLILFDNRFVYSSKDKVESVYLLSISYVEHIRVINDISPTKITIKALRNSINKVIDSYISSIKDIIKEYKIEL